MQRPLIYLAIFTIFFWTLWLTLAYLTTPIDPKGDPNPTVISAFLILFFGAITLTTTFFVSLFKTFRPNRKLPPLLVKDSLIQGLIIATWTTGLLMLQLLRSANPLNLILWTAILLAAEWIIFENHKGKSNIIKRRT